MENLSRYCVDSCTCRHCTPVEPTYLDWVWLVRYLNTVEVQGEPTFGYLARWADPREWRD